MKREFLKSLNLDDKVIEQIMSKNVADIENVKKSFGDVDSIKQENESYKAQLAERDKDIKSLSKQVKDNDDLSSQLSDLQDKYKTDTTNLNNQLSQTKLNGALNETLAAAKVRNPKAIKGLLNMDDIKLNEKGELVGVNDQIDSLKKSDAYLFDEGQKQGYNPAGGDGSDDKNDVQTLTNIFKGE
ncbi:phage scaffolding protein [Companilactobacillus farciminis]|uniref:phage scaffolding protein n=1 Tax=Companilactobacillus farciminis TaxID=1612 RepID=UPI00232FB17B|nr:phage scaffolding protein [Companilactobacillus farciminis]WCG34760.1 phage scaffolding protein [Companilactobacillus farciminis]